VTPKDRRLRFNKPQKNLSIFFGEPSENGYSILSVLADGFDVPFVDTSES
jgi:hypothetical protein